MKLLELLAHRKWQKKFKEELEDEMQMVFVKKEEAEIARAEYETIKSDMVQNRDQIIEAMKLMRN